MTEKQTQLKWAPGVGHSTLSDDTHNKLMIEYYSLPFLQESYLLSCHQPGNGPFFIHKLDSIPDEIKELIDSEPFASTLKISSKTIDIDGPSPLATLCQSLPSNQLSP